VAESTWLVTSLIPNLPTYLPCLTNLPTYLPTYLYYLAQDLHLDCVHGLHSGIPPSPMSPSGKSLGLLRQHFMPVSPKEPSTSVDLVLLMPKNRHHQPASRFRFSTDPMFSTRATHLEWCLYFYFSPGTLAWHGQAHMAD